ncbi:MAG TPA: SDR family oxidoreductase [Acidimicrobiales bacterium]|nr:SDR family oxidoreductase [Acidimicrobiales bacterium]
MGRFEGKVVLVTGSSSGIGEATAKAFDREGARVVVNSSSSVEAGKAVAASLTDGAYVQADIADADACVRLVAATVERFGRLDVLVNNAGVTEVIPHDDLDAATDEVFRRIFEVNVFGTFRLTRLAMPHLRADGGGAVVNVSSVAGVRPTGSSIPYAASKAALNHLTALVAKVSGPDVRVNAVAPGLVRTPWTAGWGPIHEAVKTAAPLARSAEPEDIAATVLDLAAAPYVTGQVLMADGGIGLN